jgi:hypothetical protein
LSSACAPGTLELTRTAAVEVPLADPDRIAGLARTLNIRGPGTLFSEASLDRYLVLVLGILDRLRMSGGIAHHWLDRWEYLDVIENALDTAEQADLSLLPALMLRSQRAQAAAKP